jgi:hypothetical protein
MVRALFKLLEVGNARGVVACVGGRGRCVQMCRSCSPCCVTVLAGTVRDLFLRTRCGGLYGGCCTICCVYGDTLLLHCLMWQCMLLWHGW